MTTVPLFVGAMKIVRPGNANQADQRGPGLFQRALYTKAPGRAMRGELLPRVIVSTLLAVPHVWKSRRPCEGRGPVAFLAASLKKGWVPAFAGTTSRVCEWSVSLPAYCSASLRLDIISRRPVLAFPRCLGLARVRPAARRSARATRRRPASAHCPSSSASGPGVP